MNNNSMIDSSTGTISRNRKILIAVALTVIATILSIAVISESSDISSAATPDFIYNGVGYTILTEDTGTNGTVRTTSLEDVLMTDLTIPSVVTNSDKNYIVTEIGYNSFQFKGITSVTIPDTVTKISMEAFLGCSLITTLNLGNGVSTISEGAFNSCSLIGAVVFPDSVTSIGEFAFKGCGELTTVTIPDRVQILSEGVFTECTKLKSVTIPYGVLEIEDDVFNGCIALESVTIPDSVTYLGGWIFYGCTSLKSVTISANATSLGRDAFYGCTELTSIVIPDKITSLGRSVFGDCSKLSTVTLSKSLRSTEAKIFIRCTALTSVTIPDGVTEIKDSIFEGCTSMKNITLGNNVHSIGNRVFYGCSSLEKIVLFTPTVPTLGDDVFYDCPTKMRIGVPYQSLDDYKIDPWASFDLCGYITSQAQDYTYDGKEHIGFPECKNNEYTIKGTKSATKIGDYKISVTPNGDNYWPDDTTSTRDFVWHINPAVLYISGAVVKNKEYDGTTAAVFDIDNMTVSGIADGEDLKVTGVIGVYASTDLGKDIPVTVTEYTLVGSTKSNYVISPSSLFNTKADILVRNVWIIGLKAANKEYDMTATATVTGTPALDFKYSTDDVTIVEGTYAFPSANVGTGIVLVTAGYYITGADVYKYNLAEQPVITANITQKTVIVKSGITGVDREYDGTYDAILDFSDVEIRGKIEGDSLSVTAKGTHLAKYAGIASTVYISDITLIGESAGNYKLSSQENQLSTHASITPRNVHIIGIAPENKVYDGTSIASLSGEPTLDWSYPGDDIRINKGSANFFDKIVGTDIQVIFRSWGLESNTLELLRSYNLVEQPTGTADITVREVTINGLTVANKTYDNSTKAKIGGTGELSWKCETDSVGFASGTATFSTKDAGTSIPVTFTGFYLYGMDIDNYRLIQPATCYADIIPKNVTIDGITAKNKVYDGTTNVVLIDGAFINSTHSSDTVSIVRGTARFSDINVGTSVPVIFEGYSLEGKDAGNYKLISQPSCYANITPKDVTISGISARDKMYDGTTSVILDGVPTVDGKLATDGVTVHNGTAVLSSKDIGKSIKVIFSGYTLEGSDAHNYNLTSQPVDYADITPREISISGITAEDKVYDQNTDVMLNLSGIIIDGLVGSETVDVTAEGAFANAKVGAYKTVNITSITLDGPYKGNYVLADSVQTTTTAKISAKEIVVSGITAYDKTYDGTKNAGLKCSNAVFTGMIDGDHLSVSAVGSFGDKNVGTGKTVTISELALTGNSALNYKLAETGHQTSTTAKITARNIQIQASAKDKIYDGTTDAEISGQPSAIGAIEGDSITIITGTAVFTSKNAGETVEVNFSGFGLTGDDAPNYNITSYPAGHARIYNRAVTISGITVNDKTYDGTTDAIISGTPALNGVLGEDYVLVYDTHAKAEFSSKNAGESIRVIFSGYGISGSEAGNYILAAQPVSYAKITPKDVTIEGYEAQEKIYDGTKNATITGTPVIVGKIPGDFVTVKEGKSEFEWKTPAAVSKVISTGYGLTGEDAPNYNLTAQPVIGNGSILVKDVYITAKAKDKVYDEGYDVELEEPVTLHGIVEGDDVILANGNYYLEEKDVNPAATVYFGYYQLQGDDRYNYNLINKYWTETIAVTPRPVEISGVTAESKIYDGSSAAVLDTSKAVLTGTLEEYSKGYLWFTAVGCFNSTAAGTDKEVRIEYTLTGSDASNYMVSDAAQRLATASITPKEITAISGISANDKIYDGNVSATFDCSKVVYTGMIEGDSLSLVATGSFTDKNTGKDIPVNITHIALFGDDSDNYYLWNGGEYQTTVYADIAQRSIESATVNLGPALTYNKEKQTQTVESVVVDGLTVTFTVKDNMATNAGGYELKVIGNGNFTGEVCKSFTIAKANNDITLAKSSACAYATYNVGASASENPTFAYAITSGSDKASVDKDGNITGKAIGKAVLRVNASETANYKEASKTFEIDLHDHTAEVYPGVLPTKTQSGWSEGMICYECGKILVDREVLKPTGSDKIEVSTDMSYVLYDVPDSTEIKTIAITVNSDTDDERVNVELPEQTVNYVKNKTIEVTVEKVMTKKDTFDITIRVNDIGIDKKVLITIPYDVTKGTPSVLWQKDDKNTEKMEVISIDKTNGTVTFQTYHNSVYAIEYSQEPSSNIIPVAIMIATVILAILIIAAIIIYLRKNNHGESGQTKEDEGDPHE